MGCHFWVDLIGCTESCSDLVPGSWTQLGSGATARSGQAADVSDGKMYIFGGYDGTSVTFLNDLWRYDISTASWGQLKPSSAAPREGATAVVDAGKMYIFGGDGSGNYYNDLWCYDIAGDAWSQLTPYAPPYSRTGHGTGVYSGKMYVFGGYRYDAINYGQYLNDLQRYDIASNSWLQLASGPSARINHSLVVDSGKLYVFGGTSDTTTSSATLDELWCYDIASNTWIQLASGATPRRLHTAVIQNGKMYVFGGTGASGKLNDLWCYDIASDTWSQLGGGATARQDHSCVLNAGRMYVFGGYVADTGEYLNDLWRYDIGN